MKVPAGLDRIRPVVQVRPASLLWANARHLLSCRLRMFMYTEPSRSSTAAHSSEASSVISRPLCQVRPPSSL